MLYSSKLTLILIISSIYLCSACAEQASKSNSDPYGGSEQLPKTGYGAGTASGNSEDNNESENSDPSVEFEAPNDNNVDNGGSNNGGTKPPAKPAGLNCGDLYTCEDNCEGKQSCGQLCYDSASPQAKSQWTELIKCGQQSCDGQVPDAAAYKKCLAQMCADKYDTCFSADGGTGNTGSFGPTPGGCAEGYECVKTCFLSAKDEFSFFGCVDDCYMEASTESETLLKELEYCSDQKCADIITSVQDLFQCQESQCAAQYNACMNQDKSGVGNGGNGNSGSGNSGPVSGGGKTLSTCVDIHEAILNECVPEYSKCAQNCSNESCADSCKKAIESCIEDKKNAAPAQEATEFEAVLECRSKNYEACYGEGNTSYQGCIGSCDSGDNECAQGCNETAEAAYETCYEDVCTNEYIVCGI